MKAYLILVATFLISFHLSAQEIIPNPPKKNKGTFYLLWGYNHETYTRSTIHFKNDGNPEQKNQYGVYDFKLHKVHAHDRMNLNQLLDFKNFSVPQFSFRIGYFFNDKKDQGIEINYDHTKYIVTDNQTVRISGQILGVSVDKDTVLDGKYIHFEHSDGANFAMVNYMRRWNCWTSKNLKNNFGLVLKPGLGFVYPRTDVTLFGNRINNDWHVAGVIAAFDITARAEFLNHLSIELSGKTGYANYISCLVQGQGHGNARHSFGFLEGIVCLGYHFKW